MGDTLKNKEKQIEEMAIIASKCITSWLNNETSKALPDYIAEALVNADYCKASEVVWEIFDNVDEIAYRYLNDADYSAGDMIYDLDELKKKYTEGR